MGKFYLNKVPEQERIKMIAEFYDIINCLKNRDEIRLFFRDLLSPDEIASLVRRIQVAILLLAGFTYEEISKTIGAGKDKISNVQRSLEKHGQGYRLAIKKYKRRKGAEIRKRSRIAKAGTKMMGEPGYLKAKYPSMFLISNLLDIFSDWLEDRDGDGVEVIQKAREKRRERKKMRKRRI